MKLINKTLGQCLHEQALRFGAKPAIEIKDFSCTYDELDRISDCLAARMLKLNIVKGTHVGIWGVNSPKWIMIFYALTKIGAVPVLINTCYKEIELRDILNHFNTEVLFYGEGYKELCYKDILDGIKDELKGVHSMFSIEAFVNLQQLDIDSSIEEALEGTKKSVTSDDPACMIFTSGTTSLPKGVVLSHSNIINNATAMIKAMHWGPCDKMCISVPLFHCFGITAGIISCMLAGMSVHLLAYFKTRLVWDAVEKGGCTVLNGVPSMFLALIRKSDYINRDGSGLRSGIIAGSAVKVSEYLEICDRFPNMHLQPSYGQTETSPCISIADWDEAKEIKALSAGKVLEGVEVRIADPATDKEVANGESGEIQVRGYNVMKGYYNMPEANEQVFTKDGWLKCGDLGHVDDEGFLYITGRIKEMIIRAGENICPAEIEEALLKLDCIDQAKVVGVPAQVRQEEIAACIILKKGCMTDKEAIRSKLERRLAHYKIPEYYVFMDSFPMNASGKINLQEIKRLAEQEAEISRQQPAQYI